MQRTLKSFGWPTCTGIALSTGVWTTALLWLVTRNAWVGVFATGMCLGFQLLQNWLMSDEIRLMQGEIQALKARRSVETSH